jgi:hypothetical protein
MSTKGEKPKIAKGYVVRGFTKDGRRKDLTPHFFSRSAAEEAEALLKRHNEKTREYREIYLSED